MINRYDRRMGIIAMADHFIARKPRTIAYAFGEIRFLPVDVRYDWFGQKVEYVGVSPHFRELKEGEEAPYYNIIIRGKDVEVTEAA